MANVSTHRRSRLVRLISAVACVLLVSTRAELAPSQQSEFRIVAVEDQSSEADPRAASAAAPVSQNSLSSGQSMLERTVVDQSALAHLFRATVRPVDPAAKNTSRTKVRTKTTWSMLGGTTSEPIEILLPQPVPAAACEIELREIVGPEARLAQQPEIPAPSTLAEEQVPPMQQEHHLEIAIKSRPATQTVLPPLDIAEGLPVFDSVALEEIDRVEELAQDSVAVKAPALLAGPTYDSVVMKESGQNEEPAYDSVAMKESEQHEDTSLLEAALIHLQPAPVATATKKLDAPSALVAMQQQKESVPIPTPEPEASEPVALSQCTSGPAVGGCCGECGSNRCSGHCRSGNCPYCPTQSGAHWICGVDCSNCCAPCNSKWRDMGPIPWSIFGPGEYVGPPRAEHVPTYYLRVNDQLDVIYMRSRQKMAESYRIGIGDRMLLESMNEDDDLDRELEVQPDGTVSIPLLGEIQVSGKTLKELKDLLTERLKETQRDPQITLSLVTTNVALADLIDAVDRRAGSGGQSQLVTVTPEGTIQLPGLGSVYVQGLTLEELQRELETRYTSTYGVGLSVTPMLTQRAPSYVFIGGEASAPGRYTLEGPTTVMQAITLAGGWNVGGNTNQIVVFRRDDNWCLKATKIDLFKPLYGKDPCPVNDVWLRDNDLVIVPKRPILVADDVINLYFTRGAYSVLPVNFFYNFSHGTVLAP